MVTQSQTFEHKHKRASESDVFKVTDTFLMLCSSKKCFIIDEFVIPSNYTYSCYDKGIPINFFHPDTNIKKGYITENRMETIMANQETLKVCKKIRK